MRTQPNKAILTGWILLLALTLVAQKPAGNPFDSLDLTGPAFKGGLVKKAPTWPWWAAGIAAGTGAVIYLAVPDEDEEKPFLSAQNDAITLICGGSGSLNVLANDTGEGISLQGFSQPSGAIVTHSGGGVLQFSNVGATNFTFSYTLVDRVGQTASAMVAVSVQLPVFQLQPDNFTAPIGQNISGNVLANDMGVALRVTGSTPPASGNLQMNADGSFLFSPDGCAAVSIQYTAEDACGQIATAQVQLTYNDDAPPTISCPQDITIACNQNPEPTLTGNPTVQDNCDPQPNTGYSDDYGGTPCNQLIDRIWFAADAAQNNASCLQRITRNDDQAPALSGCPDNVTVDCDAVPPPASVAATDNCQGAPEIVFSENTGPGTEPGEIQILTRTWTTDDGCGNTAGCSHTISVQDVAPPTVTCPDPVTVACSPPPDPALTGSATGSDNCGSVTLTFVNDPAGLTGCNGTGLLLRTWTATDEVGLTASCQHMITLIDNTPPVWSPCPPAITVSCGQQFDLGLTGAGTLLDDCGGSFQGLFSDDLSGLAGCTGVVIRTWTGADACGNVAPGCIQQISIVPVACGFEPGFDVTPANCGDDDGIVSVSVSPPGAYTYLWENGSTEPVRFDLPGGAYSVTITDPVNFCTEIFAVTVPEIPPVYIDNSSTQPAFCGDVGDIILDLNASGGGVYEIVVEGPVNVTIPNVPPGTVNIAGFAPVEAGIYTITVQSPGGCAETLILEVPYIPPFQLSVLDVTPPSCPTCSDGLITLQVENFAVLPLQVYVNDMLLGLVNSHTFNVTNVPAGTFTFHIVDNGGNGCASNPVTVTLEANAIGDKRTGRPWIGSGPVPNGPDLLASPLTEAIRSHLPEHPDLPPATHNYVLLRPGVQLGLRFPAGPNREWLLESGHYSGEWFGQRADGLAVRTPFNGFRHQAGLRQFLPFKGKAQPYAELGACWERLDVAYSRLRNVAGAWQTVDTPLRIDAYTGFLRTGVRIRINDRLLFEVDNRFNWQPGAPINTLAPQIRTGLQAQLN